jgi:hypothetical protein
MESIRAVRSDFAEMQITADMDLNSVEFRECVLGAPIIILRKFLKHPSCAEISGSNPSMSENGANQTVSNAKFSFETLERVHGEQKITVLAQNADVSGFRLDQKNLWENMTLRSYLQYVKGLRQVLSAVKSVCVKKWPSHLDAAIACMEGNSDNKRGTADCGKTDLIGRTSSSIKSEESNLFDMKTEDTTSINELKSSTSKLEDDAYSKAGPVSLRNVHLESYKQADKGGKTTHLIRQNFLKTYGEKRVICGAEKCVEAVRPALEGNNSGHTGCDLHSSGSLLATYAADKEEEEDKDEDDTKAVGVIAATCTLNESIPQKIFGPLIVRKNRKVCRSELQLLLSLLCNGSEDYCRSALTEGGEERSKLNCPQWRSSKVHCDKVSSKMHTYHPRLDLSVLNGTYVSWIGITAIDFKKVNQESAYQTCKYSEREFSLTNARDIGEKQGAFLIVKRSNNDMKTFHGKSSATERETFLLNVISEINEPSATERETFLLNVISESNETGVQLPMAEIALLGADPATTAAPATATTAALATATTAALATATTAAPATATTTAPATATTAALATATTAAPATAARATATTAAPATAARATATTAAPATATTAAPATTATAATATPATATTAAPATTAATATATTAAPATATTAAALATSTAAATATATTAAPATAATATATTAAPATATTAAPATAATATPATVATATTAAPATSTTAAPATATTAAPATTAATATATTAAPATTATTAAPATATTAATATVATATTAAPATATTAAPVTADADAFLVCHTSSALKRASSGDIDHVNECSATDAFLKVRRNSDDMFKFWSESIVSPGGLQQHTAREHSYEHPAQTNSAKDFECDPVSRRIFPEVSECDDSLPADRTGEACPALLDRKGVLCLSGERDARNKAYIASCAHKRMFQPSFQFESSAVIGCRKILKRSKPFKFGILSPGSVRKRKKLLENPRSHRASDMESSAPTNLMRKRLCEHKHLMDSLRSICSPILTASCVIRWGNAYVTACFSELEGVWSLSLMFHPNLSPNPSPSPLGDHHSYSCNLDASKIESRRNNHPCVLYSPLEKAALLSLLAEQSFSSSSTSLSSQGNNLLSIDAPNYTETEETDMQRVLMLIVSTWPPLCSGRHQDSTALALDGVPTCDGVAMQAELLRLLKCCPAGVTGLLAGVLKAPRKGFCPVITSLQGGSAMDTDTQCSDISTGHLGQDCDEPVQITLPSTHNSAVAYTAKQSQRSQAVTQLDGSAVSRNSSIFLSYEQLQSVKLEGIARGRIKFCTNLDMSTWSEEMQVFYMAIVLSSYNPLPACSSIYTHTHLHYLLINRCSCLSISLLVCFSSMDSFRGHYRYHCSGLLSYFRNVIA